MANYVKGNNFDLDDVTVDIAVRLKIVLLINFYERISPGSRFNAKRVNETEHSNFVSIIYMRKSGIKIKGFSMS